MVWCCDADEVVWRFWGAADVEGISVSITCVCVWGLALGESSLLVL
jgi:hypothetical protein